MTSDDDELLDLVDANNQVIGSITHSEAFRLSQTKLGYVRAANALLINSNGKLWIPRRTLSKKLLPGALDFSVSEHVQAGESYDEAIVRGFMEELSLTIRINDLEFVGISSPIPVVPYFSALYIYTSDTEPDFNRDDYIDATWLSVSELQAEIQRGISAKDSLLPSLDLLLSHQAQRHSNQ